MDTLSNALISFAQTVIELFPEDPILDYLTASEDVQAFFGYLNWFIPIDTILDITAAWLICVAVYYVYQIVLRWIKVIE